LNLLIDAGYVIGAYLLGSAPHLFALARLQHIHLEGDARASLWKRGNKFLTVLGIIGEFAKGAIPVLAGRALNFDIAVVAIAGLAAVGGQMWPVFRRFDGEKGNTIGLGMAAALTPLALLPSLVPIAMGVIIRTIPRLLRKTHHKQEPVFGGPFSRSIPIGMMGTFLALPLAAWLWKESLATVTVYCALFLLLLIRRLTAGLKKDLELSEDVGKVIKGRLLYDRSLEVEEKSKVKS
jgi:glycerol-3-phosphate acyltransferase PlsY